MSINKRPAFTLVELLVALVVSSILISITASTYGLFRKSIVNDQAKADISQNARITLDRLTRDIRQTPDIVTLFPANSTDISVPQPGQIEFEDGHAQDLTYLKYYLSGTNLEMDTKQYYFSYDPSTRVHWNSVGTGGVTPVANVISTQLIAEKVQSLVFYGYHPLQVIITTTDGAKQTFQLRTDIYERNI